MAWYRRRAPMRRRRFRRRKRIIRRRRFVRRNNKGSMFCKFTKVSTVDVPNNQTSIWNASFLPTDFDEFTKLAPNFEYVQFLKVKVRVLPMQSISNNSTSKIPSYCMLPWHRDDPPTKTLSFNSFISQDRCKIYRQTERGKQMYVPNTLIEARASTATDSGAHTVYWKPRVERTTQTQELPRIFCGLIAFQGDAALTLQNGTFDIITDVWVKCANQNTLIP
ncbi:putative capsid protein [Arboreal ant associated circular virus 1]|uniref:Putative capsid protein n=1 Tax=Arboreal ant associated circular virus 1 TaxID=2293273 RepID=A0A346BP87_9CIRC|nr:putative capsid protein [Arboreal ant associated circular virus 1]AXL65884.1 putative capsid protein [Arboreal ant associated circular virus 1]AXL65886.1 putative capsid protein [Arboreal ant associated circular virus 1]AXL65888.1 putative capsid protein [Arboreal ant associated circular virus 1]